MFTGMEIQHHNRHLGDSADENSMFVDKDGNSYPPYSLAWRYLGLFIDCGEGSDDGQDDKNNRHRRLEDGNSASCQRKVMWAAYHDKGYRGGSIGEYSFYDTSTGGWDASTCRAQTWWPFTRCRRMNCHLAHTHFTLVGIYKETYGLVDWSEQLFKHQGYCLWDGDKQDSGDGSDDEKNTDQKISDDYDFMESLRENWVQECTQLDYTDSSGNTIYLDTKPLSAGDMTYGVYTDASCLTESNMTWSDYTSQYGSENSNDQNDDYSTDETTSFDRWNELLSDYKICQPCRAYNRVRESQDGSHDSGSDDNEDGDDGEGGNEHWGFNCYDNAGYRNCNQCYKFATQTDMEVATTSDLELATKQGTILAIQVDTTTYGRGHYRAPGHYRQAFKKSSVEILFTMVLVAVGYSLYEYVWKHRRVDNPELNDALTVATVPCCDDDDDRAGDIPKHGSRTPTKKDSHGRKKLTRRVDTLTKMLQDRDQQLSVQERRIEQLEQELNSYRLPQQSLGSPSSEEQLKPLKKRTRTNR